MILLYHYGPSVCSQKVRLVLAEKELSWEARDIDLRAGEQFSGAYRAINPRAEVPALVDDGELVVESSIINEYLEDRYSRPSLRPVDAIALARMREWIKRIDDQFHAACGALTFALLAGQRVAALAARGESIEDHVSRIPDPARRERQRQVLAQGVKAASARDAIGAFRDTLATLDALLVQRRWIAGQNYSLADAAWAPYVLRLEMLQLSTLWDRLPALARWYDRNRERANWPLAIDAFMSPEISASLLEAGSEALPWIRSLIQRNPST